MNNTLFGVIPTDLHSPISSHHAFFLFGLFSLIITACLLVCICFFFFDFGGTRTCLEAARRRKYAPLDTVVVSSSFVQQPLLQPLHSIKQSKPPQQHQQQPVNLRALPFAAFPRPPHTVPVLSPPPPPPSSQQNNHTGRYLKGNVFVQ